MTYIIALFCLLGGVGIGVFAAARKHYWFFHRLSHKKFPNIEKEVSRGLLKKKEELVTVPLHSNMY